MQKTLLLAALCCLFVCSFAHAHRVNIFAFVDGDVLQVECSFSRSQKVRFGEVAASDAVTGENMFTGKTDEKGVLRFRPPQRMLASGNDMLLSLNAGEGHKNQWTVSAAELAGIAPSGAAGNASPGASPGAAGNASPGAAGDTGSQSPASSVAGEARAVAPTAPTAAATAAPTAAAPIASMPAQELEALVGKVMDAKLAPFKEALGEMRTQGPGLKDIIGGLGWIFGLLGIAAYMKYRK